MQPLSILAPTRYPHLFNSPRSSVHRINRRSFIPFNFLHSRLDGLTIFNPLPPANFDLVHAFNRIPVGSLPYVIGFESHLPRVFGLENTRYHRLLRASLTSDRCLGIVAISEHAKRIFLATNKGTPEYDALARKLHVRYPNMRIAVRDDVHRPAANRLTRVVFVGNHFGRKGGCVAVRLAELAMINGTPLAVDIISTLETGPASWTDPLSPDYFDEYVRLLRLPNVRHFSGLSNHTVLSLLNSAHFVLLPTFSDTFGYSAIEAMANYVPVIATAQGALPEFIRDGDNGILLDLPTTAFGEWIHISADRSSPRFAAIHRDEVNRLAEMAAKRIWDTLSDPAEYGRMRQSAYDTASRLFSSEDASQYWDTFYWDVTSRK